MTQYVINIGAIPNDGTGDPLRTAFNETNLNFDQVFAAGPVLSNVRIANNSILTTTTNGNLILAPNGIGRIQANATIVPSVANVRDLGSSTQRWSTVYAQYLDVSAGTSVNGDLNVDGNLIVQGNIIQVGNIVTDSKTIQLANTAGTANAANGSGITVGANDDIATFLYSSAGNRWNTNIGLRVLGLANVSILSVNQTANSWIIAGNIITAPSGAKWTSNPEFLDEFITSAPDGYINLQSLYANSNVASQVHLEHGLAQIVVDNGSEYIWEFDNSGNLTLPGNTFAVNYANGNPVIINSSSYGNANVATFLANFGSNTISTTGAVNTGSLSVTGNIIPAANAVYSLGNSTNYWSNLWVANNTIYIGGVALGMTAGNVLTVNGNAVLTNGSNTAVSTTGNITAGNIGITGGNLTWANASIVQTSASDLSITGDGQVTVRSLDGTYQWTFDSNGNLTAPGNVSATGNVTGNYFFGDGSQLTGISANTGNVTFSGEAVIGTGTSNTVSGLYLAPDPGSLANDLYLRVRGNILDEPTHIHFDTGNNQYYNQFIGDDNKYIQLANTGNIVINTNNYAGNTAQWDFGTDGTLTLPAGSSRITSYGQITIETDNNASGMYLNADGVNLLYANANVTLRANSTGTNKDWNFGNTGVLTLPLGGIITETSIPGGAFTGNTIALKPQGGIDADQQLLIYPTAGPVTDDNHLHLTTGNLYNTELYLGNDNLYVKLANTGNVVVNSNDNAGNTAQWTFDTTGSLTLPGGSRLRPLGANLDIFAGTGSYVNLITSDESSSVGVDNGGGYIVTAGGTWDFDTTGNLTAPGNVSAVGNITAGNISTGQGLVQSLDITADGIINAGALNVNSSAVPGATGNITGGNLSVSGNITANYFIGDGSQLTGITASVPSQTILPTIQTITVEARPAGLFGGGQGGANVTVANTIPVTEYGVIITDGTTNEKYKTGSLGSIPGTVSLTFDTGLNSTQFTVFAYVTSNAGTFYSNSATGTSGICLLAGTQISLSDGTYKAIEHITYTDKLLSWDFDRGCYAETTAMWIKRGETGSQYNLLTFSDGTTLRTFDQHRIFNKQAGAFTYPMTDETPVGTVTVNEHGQEITLIDKQVVVDTIEYYNVITDYHMNLFSDSVLTSCRFNNIYPITDMKFVKDARTLRTRAEFENVPDRFFHGLRLAEQTTNIETVEWYVNRLLSTEVITQPEMTF